MYDDLPKPLTPAMERMLFAILNNKTRSEGLRAKARNAIVMRNVRMAEKITFNLLRRHEGARPFEEDILADLIAYIPEVVDRFDPTKGNKFSTPLWFSLAGQAKSSYKHHSFTVRITDGVDARTANRSCELDDRFDWGCYPDECEVEARETTEQVAAMLATLAPREQVVLRARFGFGGKPQTLERVGKGLGLTKERCRQLQRDALAKLRAAAAGLEFAGVGA